MKKIDIKKSKILGMNENDTDGLQLGIEGFFSHYSDFEPYTVSILDGFTYNKFMTREKDPNGCSVNQWYEYFIPTSKVVFVKEKKLRPFENAEEFFKVTRTMIGNIIRYRQKSNVLSERIECNVIINGYTSAGCILIGAIYYKLIDLFDAYEYYDNATSEWKCFGVEDEKN